MKIRKLPILARIDQKTQKRQAAAKKFCGWENPAIYEDTFIIRKSFTRISQMETKKINSMKII